jgi:hypothetical protein
MMLAPAPASCFASVFCMEFGHESPSVPQCMNTITTSATLCAARTASSVRVRLLAIASPDRVGVAIHELANSCTSETPR